MFFQMNLLLVLYFIISHVQASGENDKNARPKSKLFKRLLVEAERPPSLYPEGELKNMEKYNDVEHTVGGNALFSVHIKPELDRANVLGFIASLREVYDGDIVLGVNETTPEILSLLTKHRVIVYKVDLTCFEPRGFCIFDGHDGQAPLPVALLRYYLYQQWAAKYSKESLLMVSDFRDVFFQADPFEYKPHEWQEADIVTFLEPHPNKIINRCMFNGPWIGACYGKEAVKKVGFNIVSCSGVTMGKRDGMLVYASLVARHSSPEIRNKYLQLSAPPSQKKCISTGTDQGIHNWLLYSGILRSIMNVVTYAQGEGPVNNLGSFFGGRKKIFSIDLADVKVFQHGPKGTTVHNWNKELSPVVHQADRFLNSTMLPGLFNHTIAALRSAIYDSGEYPKTVDVLNF